MGKEIFTKSETFKQEYSATIVRVGELKNIENSDNLKQVIIDGFSVVVNKNDVKEGDYMIYCKNETALNAQFLSVNNMFEIGERHLNENASEVEKLIDEGKTDEAKKLVGYFNKHGRVKMIKLRGCPSMGVLLRLESFINWDSTLADVILDDYVKYDENGNFIPFDFDTVNENLFIKAYVPKTNACRSGGGTGQKKDKTKRFNRMLEGEWSFHYDTNQLNSNMWKFSPEDVVDISVKIHGCVERNTIINTMEYGDITIGEIVDKKINCHIKAYDVETNTNVWVPIDNYYLMKNDGEWYEIELEDGRTITITGNNPVWIPELNLYRRVDELDGTECLLVD